MTSFTEDTQNYLGQNRAAAERIADAFAAAGGDSSDLDDMVFDVAGSYGSSAANQTEDEDEQEAVIAGFESQASEINNGSPVEQVAAILMGHGIEEGERLVMAATPASAPSAR